MTGEVQLAVITGSKSGKGWRVKVAVEQVVDTVSAPEELAALLEKIACTASADAAHIRQNISAYSDG